MTGSRGHVWRFYAYRLSVSNGFYLPVSILYLQRVRGFGLGEIGLVMGAFSILSMLAEIPTGYVGDRVGRRESLAIGNVLSVVFMAGYVLVDAPLGYLAIHAVWAFAWAFRSGTADAWLYELLAVDDDEDEFTRVRSRAMTVELGFEALSAAAAGALVVFVGWGVPFLANAVVAALGLPVLLSAPSVDEYDDETPEEAANDPFSVREAIDVLRLQASRPELRWVVVYLALFFGLYSSVRTFEQPALDTVGVPVAALGLLYAGFKTVSAAAASTSGWLSERLGAGTVFGLLIPVYGVAFLGVAAAPALLIPVLFLNRSIRVVVQPIRDQYLNDRLENTGRATVLSGASMVLSIAMGLSKFVAGAASAAVGVVRFLVIAALTVAALGAVVWVGLSPIRPDTSPPVEDAAAPTD
jgi:MFS family permease